jgi:hypothetical protein
LQAVRDPDGREIVESLLLELERRNEQRMSSGEIRLNVGGIRKLLKLLPTEAQVGQRQRGRRPRAVP